MSSMAERAAPFTFRALVLHLTPDLHTELQQQLVARLLDSLPAALANPAFDPAVLQAYARHLIVSKRRPALCFLSSCVHVHMRVRVYERMRMRALPFRSAALTGLLYRLITVCQR